ncbi:hypothetical protein AB1283_23835 [Bacillus sp. S13(2024)]|uniref:hypothetical protein n=1 Tax=unclassified Bacillus (in: firmicutes) TaxID=185979 RepID=UPI003D1E4EF5
MKMKIIIVSMVFIVVGDAGIYKAVAVSPNLIKTSAERLKETIQQSKKEKSISEEEKMHKTANKLGVSTEGKTKEQIDAVRSKKRQELLREYAKELGIEIEGKTDEQFIQEIDKIQHSK